MPKATTKLTIELEYSLPDLKKAYKRFFGKDFNPNIKKADLASWIGGLMYSELESILAGSEKEEEEGE